MSNASKWLKQVDNVHSGKAVVCPNCGSNNTKAVFFRFADGIGYGDMACKDCDNSLHISRMKFPEDTKADITEIK
jgi:uncharacterized protein (DUF983 family)